MSNNSSNNGNTEADASNSAVAQANASVASTNAANGNAAATAAPSNTNGHGSHLQPPFFADVHDGARYSKGNHYAASQSHDYYGSGYAFARLRHDQFSGRFATVSQDLGNFVTGVRCPNGDALNVDHMCCTNGTSVSPPSVRVSDEDSTRQLDSMFFAYVPGASAELRPVERAIMIQRSPFLQPGTVYGELRN